MYSKLCATLFPLFSRKSSCRSKIYRLEVSDPLLPAVCQPRGPRASRAPGLLCSAASFPARLPLSSPEEGLLHGRNVWNSVSALGSVHRYFFLLLASKLTSVGTVFRELSGI